MDNKVDRLRNKEIFRTTKPQAPVKLIIDNAKLSSRDIGINTSCQYLHTLVENVYQRYHRIYLEGFGSLQDPRSSVNYNGTLLTLESWA
jgi:Ribonuclease G/E